MYFSPPCLLLNKPFIRNIWQITTQSSDICLYEYILIHANITDVHERLEWSCSFHSGTTLVFGRSRTVAPTSPHLSSQTQQQVLWQRSVSSYIKNFRFHVRTSLWTKVVIQHWAYFIANPTRMTSISFTVDCWFAGSLLSQMAF